MSMAEKLTDIESQQVVQEAEKIKTELISRKNDFFELNITFSRPTRTSNLAIYNLGFFENNFNYWNAVSLLNYYLNPKWLYNREMCPKFSDYDNLGNNILHLRTDTTASSIVKNTTILFVKNLMPKGFYSFKINFDKVEKILQLKTSEGQPVYEDSIISIRKIEDICTFLLHEELNREENKLKSKIKYLAQDYLNFGTCIAIVNSENKVTHVPFTQAALGNTEDDDLQELLWLKPVTHKRDSMPYTFYHTFYIPEKKGYRKITYDSYGKYNKEINKVDKEYQGVEVTYTTSEEVLVARMNDYGDIYGFGSGLNALAPIVQINFYSNCKNLAAIGQFYPATMISEDAKIHKLGRELYKHHQDRVVQMDKMPGTTLVVGRDELVVQSGVAPLSNLSTPANDIEVFKSQIYDCSMQIEKAYTAVITSGPDYDRTRGLTATQVNKTEREASVMYTGMSDTFYTNILYPIVKRFASKILENINSIAADDVAKVQEGYPNFNPTKDFKIEIYDVEKKAHQKEQVEDLTILAQTMANLGVQPNENSVKKLSNKLEELV